jgi:hypothetical protein
MSLSYEGRNIDARLSRLVGLEPAAQGEDSQQDWNAARSFLKYRFAGKFPRHVYDNDDFLQECLQRAFRARKPGIRRAT